MMVLALKLLYIAIVKQKCLICDVTANRCYVVLLRTRYFDVK